MTRPYQDRTFKRGFLARTRILREAGGFEPHQMAKLLGVKSNTYSRYENRSPLPHHLIPRFLELTGGTADYLFNIKSGKSPVKSPKDRAREAG